MKRAIGVVLGSALVIWGLRRRSLGGVTTMLVGGWVVTRVLGDNTRVKRVRRMRTVTGDRRDGRSAMADTQTVSRTITIGKPAGELYEAWRDTDQFSRVMGHFADVTASDEDHLNWTIHGPRGKDLSWETRIVEEEPGEYLRWKTPADAVLPYEGSVGFHPAAGDRGTVVTLSVSVDPPGGTLGNIALERFGILPETLAGEVLHRFKSLVETGEIPTLERNPSARGSGDLI